MPAGLGLLSFFAISPRHLEAVLTKTCQVLVAGSTAACSSRAGTTYRFAATSPTSTRCSSRSGTSMLEQIAEQAYEEIVLSGR